MIHKAPGLIDMLPAGIGVMLAAVGEAAPLPGMEYLTVPGILMVVLWFVGTLAREYLKSVSAREARREAADIEKEKITFEASRERERLQMERTAKLEDSLVNVLKAQHEMSVNFVSCMSQVNDTVATLKGMVTTTNESQSALLQDLSHVIAQWRKSLPPCLAMGSEEGRDMLQKRLDHRKEDHEQGTDL